VLVYDGECGFCERSVRRVLQRDPNGLLRFAARDGAYGTALLVRHPHLVDVDSLLWVDPVPDGREEVHSQFDAVLRTSRYLGGAWRVLELTRIIPGSLRDMGYRFVARHRHRLGHRGEKCLIPSAEEQARFLD
jgi:predicted DCC family thiol-disulfide oxidoreductase YuxK